MPVIDTSFLLAVFDEQHEKHERARRRLASAGLVYVAPGVLGELTTIVRRRANDAGLDGETIVRSVLARLEALSIYRHVTIGQPDRASHLYRETKGISYVDAYGVALAMELGEPLFTLDARQERLFRKAAR